MNGLSAAKGKLCIDTTTDSSSVVTAPKSGFSSGAGEAEPGSTEPTAVARGSPRGTSRALHAARPFICRSFLLESIDSKRNCLPSEAAIANPSSRQLSMTAIRVSRVDAGTINESCTG